MNPGELFSDRCNATESRFSSIPTRIHNSYSSSKVPHGNCVNNDALNLSATNTHINLQDDVHPFSNIGVEVRTLRKALNLPVEYVPISNSLTSFSSHFLNQHGSRNSQGYLTDSGYSSNAYPQSGHAMKNGAASRNGEHVLYGHGYSTLDSSNEVTNCNSSCPSHELNSSWENSLNSSRFYERSLKSSLDESESKRSLLLEKLREAHLTIQNQAEKLTASESEMCFLRGQLKSIGIEQEGLQQELDCLTMEKKTLEFFKSESLKNREEFLIRVNDLDKALKALTATHIALHTQAQKKEADLEKTTFYVTTLQQDNDELQEVNNGLRKELCSLRNIVDQMPYKSDIGNQLQQLNKDYQKILQEQAVVKRQLSENMKATEEARNKEEKLNQQIAQLRMERDIQCGKVIILEEEILHRQQSYSNLVKEQEHLLKDKAELDMRLQREIQERLCLKMVNDLLKEESAHVKEAFQKLEEFTSSLEQKSKDTSLLLDQCKPVNQSGSTEEMVDVECQNGDLFLKIASAKSHCEKLESQVLTLQERNRKLNMEKEDIERKLQFVKMREDALTEQVSKSKGVQTETETLKRSLNTMSKRNEDLVKKLEYKNEEMETLKDKLLGLSSETESHQNCSISFLEEEVDRIKETVKRLECEKTELISEVSKLHKEQDMWALQRSELEMTHAELRAENSQLRSELATKLVANGPENSIAEVKTKFELEKEGAAQANEDLKESFDEVCFELKTVKSELSKVWDMLEVKGKQLEEQSHELQLEQEQSQKSAEELTQLRKVYADLTAKTSSRSQMICTLRDELMQRCREIVELETALTSAKQQKDNTSEKSPLQSKNTALKRRRSDSDISKSHSQCTGTSHKECTGKTMAAVNTHLNQRVQELMAERDLALQDSQDLLNGMQQLRDAFEEEMQRELEQERTKFVQEKQLLQNAKSKEDDEHSFAAKSTLETKITLLTAEKIALEVKSKNLECERDELRNQVEELCRMRAAAEEKAVQVDSALSPRKRENKTTVRKRSKSVGMIPPSMTVPEVPLSFPQE